MRNSSNPKYAHLHFDLHVRVTSYAPPPVAYCRLGYALYQLRQFVEFEQNHPTTREMLPYGQGLHIMGQLYPYHYAPQPNVYHQMSLSTAQPNGYDSGNYYSQRIV